MLLLLIASVPLVLASVAFSAPTSAPTAAIEAAVSQAPTATTTATTAAAANAGDGLDVPTLAVDAGSLSVAQLVCNGRCSGLSTFWRDVGNEWSALPPEAGGAVRCQAVRRHAATVRCALDLWDEPSCLDIRKEFVDLSMNCTSWGVDVAEDAVGDEQWPRCRAPEDVHRVAEGQMPAGMRQRGKLCSLRLRPAKAAVPLVVILSGMRACEG
eukprot:TRINITY_DN4672_c0_g2_i3.p1 TRINITY_DN4672_c0_g2~~TRINITY_DN4672_c0_g2_i3.p1  ORF type:complete len:212 (+),score=36.18 TRINITY_DN4672_c0_g2_i3:72-707(+)